MTTLTDFFCGAGGSSSGQAEAIRRGIKISGFADPEDVPILHAVHGLVLLTDDGLVHQVGKVVAS